MNMQTNRLIREMTSELRAEWLYELDLAEPELYFRPVPHDPALVGHAAPVWRVRLDLAYNPNRSLGLEINDELTMGRGEETPGFVSLDDFDADELGVSRAHLALRPTESQLFVVDLGSTNGTWLNRRSIGVNTPFHLSNGDLLTLGKLEFLVRIVERPAGSLDAHHPRTDPANMLLSVAKILTAHLDMDDVLDRAVEMTMSAIAAEETSLWLIDERTSELVLEVARGIAESAHGMRLSVSETLAGKVIRTGKPVRTHRQMGDDQIKVKTGYLVEAVMYVPLTVAGVPIGVLSAAHHEAGQRFNERDQIMLGHIADFTAIAVQNARLYEFASRALDQRDRVVTALSYALSCDAKALLNTMVGYTGLLDIYTSSSDDTGDLIRCIVSAGEDMAALLDRMVEATNLSDTNIIIHQRCDLIETVRRAMKAQQCAAEEKRTALNLEINGTPYPIFGDEVYLYRSVLNLVDNAIKFSGHRASVLVSLAFSPREITIGICDTGPGIPEDLLPHLFNRYFRGRGTTNSKPGIGLGLEIVRETVEAHRGTVTARNCENAGAEFVITLPGALCYTSNDKVRPA
ncbi:MAG: GAF domain-containing protein [Chloroflexi bacterium]|nr:GAF domain-containing protein [Chloroflexota bacterium]